MKPRIQFSTKILHQRLPRRHTTQISTHRKTQILKRDCPLATIQKITSHLHKFISHINTYQRALKKINLEAGDHLKAFKKRLDSPKIINHWLTNTQSIIGILQMRHHHSTITKSEPLK